ncbi:unnamed protein product [Pseudo-nitzschia multistriata]|uniref:Uncharacterized protein n=1 Tax=Pseudo-nitzschia multistriata TaxID=183589 RepID=A0A448YWE0_9STRA|nr:unnamed protein product [Pseudo-nitzschia multistriata]
MQSTGNIPPLAPLHTETCVVADPAAQPNDSLNWESRGLVVQVYKSLDTAQPPVSIDIASTLGAGSDLPLAIRKACRFWFDPSIKTKGDVSRYLNSVSRSNGFKISTLSNSKQGLDRRAQLVCSRGMVARKPRGKRATVQTTTTRPISNEQKCPFSFTVYECRRSARWYFRKFGNGSRMHCGHCKLLPQQVGIRQFQNLTERNGENWSEDQTKSVPVNAVSPKEGNADRETKLAKRTPKVASDVNKAIDAAFTAHAQQGGSATFASSVANVVRDQFLERMNGADNRISHANKASVHVNEMVLEPNDLSHFLSRKKIDWSGNIPHQQIRGINNYRKNNREYSSMLEKEISHYSGFASRKKIKEDELERIENHLNTINDKSFILDQAEIHRNYLAESKKCSPISIKEEIKNIIAKETGKAANMPQTNTIGNMTRSNTNRFVEHRTPNARLLTNMNRNQNLASYCNHDAQNMANMVIQQLSAAEPGRSNQLVDSMNMQKTWNTQYNAMNANSNTANQIQKSSLIHGSNAYGGFTKNIIQEPSGGRCAGTNFSNFTMGNMNTTERMAGIRKDNVSILRPTEIYDSPTNPEAGATNSKPDMVASVENSTGSKNCFVEEDIVTQFLVQMHAHPEIV